MSESLRIAVFANSFPVVSETFIIRQVAGSVELGHDVRVFADARPAAGSPTHPEVDRAELLSRTTYIDGPPESLVWELPIKPITARTWPPGEANSIPNWRRWIKALPCLIRCAARTPGLTRQVLDQNVYHYQAQSFSGLYRLNTLSRQPGRFDVLHAHFGPVGNSYRFARDLWKAPLVVSFHGYDFSTEPRKQGSSMYENLFCTADLITVNSAYTRSAVENLGCPRKKLRVLPVGLDPKQFEFSERRLAVGRPPVLITVARLTEIKGHEFALRAIATLKEAVPGLRYDIVGEGPLRRRLEELARQLNLADSVVFHGAKDSAAVAALLGRAHLFLLTSVTVEGDREGQGLALQEAQACGLPVVATAHGALPEGLLDGGSGFLVPERDPAALASRLQWLIENSSLWPELGRVGRDFVEQHYNIDRLNEQLIALYGEAMRNYAAMTQV